MSQYSQYVFYIGATFSMAGVLTDGDNSPVDGTGWTGQSMIRSTMPGRQKITDLTFEWLDAAQGKFRLYDPNPTDAWPETEAIIDIKFTLPDGSKEVLSPTRFSIAKGATY